MSLNKKQRRLVRARSTRARIALSRMPRLSVFRSNRYICAQLISSCGRIVVTSVSSSGKLFREQTAQEPISSSGIPAASVVGTLIAKKAIEAGVHAVAFDRSGYRYHGKVKALAEAARLAGLNF